jgi:hypothetical protein
LGATLASSAPIASAAGRPQAKSSSATKTTTTSGSSRDTTGLRVYVAPFGPDPIVTPRYIYIPGFTPDPNAVPAGDDCATSGSNCTPEQLCEIWGEC